MMTRRERVEAVLRGRRPDSPPVSFWHHFAPTEATGRAAVDAHLRLLDRYDLDFLKVMNDHEYPRGDLGMIRCVTDLRKLKVLEGDTGEFARQLEVLRGLRTALGGDILLCTTLFNAWTWLRKLTAPIERLHAPPVLEQVEDPRDQVLACLLREDRSAVRAAVQTVARSLAAFARCCVEAGAHGIFLSVRDDWVDTPQNGRGTYEDLVRDADLLILESVRDAPFNILHVCGKAVGFDRFAGYPAQVLNWADREAGPTIAEARHRVKAVIAGGVDNLRTLPRGSPEECAAEVREALRQAQGHPMLITPGCTFDPVDVSERNLRAVVAAAREAGRE